MVDLIKKLFNKKNADDVLAENVVRMSNKIEAISGDIYADAKIVMRSALMKLRDASGSFTDKSEEEITAIFSKLDSLIESMKAAKVERIDFTKADVNVGINPNEAVRAYANLFKYFTVCAFDNGKVTVSDADFEGYVETLDTFASINELEKQRANLLGQISELGRKKADLEVKSDEILKKLEKGELPEYEANDLVYEGEILEEKIKEIEIDIEAKKTTIEAYTNRISEGKRRKAVLDQVMEAKIITKNSFNTEDTLAKGEGVKEVFDEAKISSDITRGAFDSVNSSGKDSKTVSKFAQAKQKGEANKKNKEVLDRDDRNFDVSIKKEEIDN